MVQGITGVMSISKRWSWNKQMKKIKTKTMIKIGISLFLSIMTLLAIYGLGWGFGAEQNLLLSMAGLPENQKWMVEGDVTLNSQNFTNPIVIDFNGLVSLAPASGKMDSHWQLSREAMGVADLLHLARDPKNWLVELPAIFGSNVWAIPTFEEELTKESVIRWVKDLQFQKKGYVSLEREYGGSISCLHLQSEAGQIPEKLIGWLEKITEQDLAAERKQALQKIIKDNMKLLVDAFITPDMKIMQISLTVEMLANFTVELSLRARPEQGQEPDLNAYYEKNVKEVNSQMLEEMLSTLEEFVQEEEE